ncbi:MAG: hypothetical protein GXP63_00150 [DPANN group archaeon]|nr:hypothetical protein [DPANN group archaeon]
MEFPVKKNRSRQDNQSRYHPTHLDTAYRFSGAVHKEMGQLVKAIVLFGATSRRQDHPHGDIDMLVVIDDVSLELNPPMIQTYKIMMAKIIKTVSPKIHLTTLRFATFWDYARAGDPLIINILRDGVAIIDTGFFDPLQRLLYAGQIRPSKEAVWVYYSRAPVTITNAEWHLLQGCIDLYWAVIDAAHAALMSRGKLPPSPDQVAKMIEEELVPKKLAHESHAQTMREFYRLMKMITHRELKTVSGQEFDRYKKEATDFVRDMKRIIERKKGHDKAKKS